MQGCAAGELSLSAPDLAISIAQGVQFHSSLNLNMFLLYLHGIDLCVQDIVTPAFCFPSLFGTLEGQEYSNALHNSEFSLPDQRVNA